MRVVFVVPESFAVGAEYLVSVLKQRGYEAFILIDPLPFQDQFLSVGLLARPWRNQRGMLRRLMKLRPDLVGFTVVSDLYPWFRDWVDAVRTVSDVPIVAGGVHPNLRPEQTMAQGGVDWLLLGECEETMPMLVEHMQGQRHIEEVPGLVWRDGESLRTNPRRSPVQDLDTLPFPDKTAWAAEGYNNRFPIIGARGCPFDCTYCYVPTWKEQDPGNKVRRRSVGNVVDEIRSARAQGIRFRSVSFLDDIFVARKSWLEEFSDVYPRDVGLPFFGYGHATTINEEIVELLKRAGCQSVTLGFQTYSEELKRKVLDRPEPNWKVARAVDLLKRAGIFVNVDVILGIPGQDVDEIKQTVRFLNENRVDGLSVHWLRYYPDAPIAQHLGPDEQHRIQGSEGSDQKFFFQGGDEEKRLTFLMYLSLMFPKAVVEGLLDGGGYQRLPALAGFNLNFPAAMLRGPVTGRRRLPVQNDTPSMARKYAKYSLLAVREAPSVQKAVQADFLRRTFIRPRLDGTGRRKLAHLARHAWRRNVVGQELPVSAVFAITYACPLGCVHCSVDEMKSRKVLRTQEAMAVLDQLAALGTTKVAFFGGEPTVRKDTPELVAHANSLGLHTSLDTAGIRVDAAYAARLQQAGIHNVNVSLDHWDPAEHDRLRQYPGAYDAARTATRHLRDQGISVVIGTYATKDKIRDGSMVRIVDTARAWGASGVKILHPILSGRYFEHEDERLSRQDMDYILLLAEPGFVYHEDAYELSKLDSTRCSSLKKQFVYIGPDGEVQPCPGIPISWGNLRQRPLAELVEEMWSHRMFQEGTGSCDTCLANDVPFRRQYLEAVDEHRLPVRIHEVDPVLRAAAAK